MKPEFEKMDLKRTVVTDSDLFAVPMVMVTVMYCTVTVLERVKTARDESSVI
jgi:hypothetical protein